MSKVADSEFGKEVGLVHKVIVTGRKVGADRNFWTTLADDVEMFKKVVDLIKLRPEFEVVVDYDRSFKEMIKAGEYNYINNDITKSRFPVKGKGQKEVTLILFHFAWDMELEDVIREMDKEGCRPATIEELLALGEAHPDLQKKFSVVAPGSKWEFSGGVAIPMTNWSWLTLYWFGRTTWMSAYRAAAVPK